MDRPVNKLAFMPILYPRSVFMLIINHSLALLKKGFIHLALSGVNHYSIRKMASVADAAGNVITKFCATLVIVLPKFRTHTARFPFVEL